MNRHELIQKAIDTIPGFTSADELSWLYESVISSPLEGDVIEIGSWCGLSSVVLGAAAQVVGCRLWCVDLFPELEDWKRRADGSWQIEINGHRAYNAEHPIYDSTFNERFRKIYSDGGSPFSVFSDSIDKFNLTKTVTPFRGDVVELLRKNGELRFRMAFVDGNHDYAGVVLDIDSLKDRMVCGGIMCVDDVTDTFHGVKSAVNDTIPGGSMLTRKLYSNKIRALEAGVLDG